jgi:hypothetical protein
MTQMETLIGRWEEIIKELSGLFEMRRGSVVEQFVETLRKDGTRTRRGPYALYSYKEKARTISQRLSDPELVETYRGQIQAFRRFQELVQEMVTLGERISEVAISDGREKKQSRSASKRTRK